MFGHGPILRSAKDGQTQECRCQTSRPASFDRKAVWSARSAAATSRRRGIPFREKAAALITEKQAGETAEKTEPPAKGTGAVDLVEALRASAEEAKGLKAGGEKAAAPGVKRPKKAPPAKERTHAAPTELDGLPSCMRRPRRLASPAASP
ncbi:hypothetical protein [Streptomyces sp. NBC_01006]|uniref:hypothetical protein n=1 Tax=Streptomyces sp. NBC_01006 TaxID=2903716 RepID=UPI00386E31F9|nr:hypothetical protein OG509_38720 [Streptomyces sp. NBC_01006]